MRLLGKVFGKKNPVQEETEDLEQLPLRSYLEELCWDGFPPKQEFILHLQPDNEPWVYVPDFTEDLPFYTGWKMEIYLESVANLKRFARELFRELRNRNLVGENHCFVPGYDNGPDGCLRFKINASDDDIEKQSLQFQNRGVIDTAIFYICSKNPTNIDEVRRVAHLQAETLQGIIQRAELPSVDGTSLTRSLRGLPDDNTGRIFYRYDRTTPGPGPRQVVRGNSIWADYAPKESREYNIAGNPDIF